MVLLINAVDSAVSSASPSANYGNGKILGVRSTGPVRQAFVYFGRPFPLGVTILSAKLRVYNTALWSGTTQLTAQRVGTSWSATKITYNNRPTTMLGSAVNVSKTNAAVNTEWEFDVQTTMQQVSDGSPWYGFRILTDSATDRYLYAAQFGGGGVVPKLEVTWSEAPQAPEFLKPDGNRATTLAKPILRCDFTDHSGSTTMQSLQVQINATDVWTSPTFDSGEVFTTIPQLDLTTTAYAGLADGASTFWRVRVRDAAGLWSQWSDSAQFSRSTAGTLTLNNPAVSPNNFVWESTPPIDWTFTVRTQRSYQVIISKANNLATWLWDSGKITASTTVVTVPINILKDTTATYNVRVRVWDTISREATPGDPGYVEVSRDFVFSNDNTVTGVSGLTGTPNTSAPWLQLDWTRATQPDKWEITRDNKAVYNDIAANLFVSGTSYRFTDRLAFPRISHTWRVYAVVNGKRDNTGASVTTSVKASSTMLCRPDGTEPVLIMNANKSAALNQISEIHEVIGDSPPVLITQSLRGREGSVSGIIADDTLSGRTAKQQRDSLDTWRTQQGIELLLYIVDEALSIVAYDIDFQPVAKSGNKVAYTVSFNFFQTDF